MIKSKAATCSLPYFLFRILILFPLSRLVFLKPNLKKKIHGNETDSFEVFYITVQENVICRLTTFSSLTLSADFLFHLAPLNKNMIEIY